MAEEVTISIEEFRHLQETINQLKQDAYDWGEREKKYQQRLDAAQKKAKAAAAAAGTASGGSGSSGWFGSGGGAGGGKQEVQELKKALANMKRLLAQTKEEHFVQTQALRENMKNLVAENESVSSQLQESNAKLLAAVSFSANAPSTGESLSGALLPSQGEGLVAFEDQRQELLDQHAAETKALHSQVEALQAAAAQATASRASSPTLEEQRSTREEELTSLRAEVALLQEQLEAGKAASEGTAAAAAAAGTAKTTVEESEINGESAEVLEERIANREAEAVERETANEKMEVQLAAREKELLEKSESLGAQEAALQKREEATAAKEQALATKEESLLVQERAVEEQERQAAAQLAAAEGQAAAKSSNREAEAAAAKESASEEVETMRQAMQHTQERLVVLTEEKNTITLQLADMVAANNALKAKAKAAEETMDASADESLERASGELKAAKEQHEREIAQLQATLSAAEEEATRSKAGEANAKEELLLTQQDREIIISKMAEQDLEIDRLKDDLKTANALAEAAKKAGEEQAELERAKGQQALAKKVRDMTEEADMLKKQVKILQEQMSAEEAEHARQLQELRSTSERASDFEELVSLKSKEIRDLRSQLADTQAMMEAAQDVAADARERADHLQEQFTSREESIIQITEKYRRVESELNAMSIRKEEVVSRNQAVIDEIKAAHTEEKQELQQQLQEALHSFETTSAELEGLRRQQAKLSKSHEHCGARIAALEKESTEQVQELARLHEEEEAQTAELSRLKEAIAIAESSLEEAEREKLEADMQHQVEKKKTQRLVKDLQARLAQRSVSAPVPVVAEAPAPSSASSSLPRRREGSAGALPVASPAPPRRSMDGVSAPRRSNSASAPAVSTDVEALGLKVGELQKRTFDQQEHIRKLREKIGSLNEQLKKKNVVIQQHLAKMPVSGRATPAMDSNKLQRAGREAGFMSRLFGGPSNSEPEAPNVTAKISQVLEDTILRNVQLQQDMDTMGHEIERLHVENKALKEGKA